MNKELKCPICGNKPNMYKGNPQQDGLCKEHFFDYFNGIIDKNEDGLFIDVATGDILNADYKKPVDNEENSKKKEEINDSIVVKCITCDNETKNGKLFCLNCYKKYVKKQLIVKISKCKEISLMSEGYEGAFRCNDGHIVKSKSEMIIDNYLYEHGIVHAYEVALVPDDDDCDFDIHPDFLLPKYKDNVDVYIEHWGKGSEDKFYTEIRNIKIDIYNKERYTVISTYESDIWDIEAKLTKKLKRFEIGKVNFTDENQ